MHGTFVYVLVWTYNTEVFTGIDYADKQSEIAIKVTESDIYQGVDMGGIIIFFPRNQRPMLS